MKSKQPNALLAVGANQTAAGNCYQAPGAVNKSYEIDTIIRLLAVEAATQSYALLAVEAVRTAAGNRYQALGAACLIELSDGSQSTFLSSRVYLCDRGLTGDRPRLTPLCGRVRGQHNAAVMTVRAASRGGRPPLPCPSSLGGGGGDTATVGVPGACPGLPHRAVCDTTRSSRVSLPFGGVVTHIARVSTGTMPALSGFGRCYAEFTWKVNGFHGEQIIHLHEIRNDC